MQESQDHLELPGRGLAAGSYSDARCKSRKAADHRAQEVARSIIKETQDARSSPAQDGRAGLPDPRPPVARRKASPPSNKNRQGGLSRETKKKEMPPAAEYCIFHAIWDGLMETVSPFVHFNSTQKAVFATQRWTSGTPVPALFSTRVLCVPFGSLVFNLFQRFFSGVAMFYNLVIPLDKRGRVFVSKLTKLGNDFLTGELVIRMDVLVLSAVNSKPTQTGTNFFCVDGC